MTLPSAISAVTSSTRGCLGRRCALERMRPAIACLPVSGHLRVSAETALPPTERPGGIQLDQQKGRFSPASAAFREAMAPTRRPNRPVARVSRMNANCTSFPRRFPQLQGAGRRGKLRPVAPPHRLHGGRSAANIYGPKRTYGSVDTDATGRQRGLLRVFFLGYRRRNGSSVGARSRRRSS